MTPTAQKLKAVISKAFADRDTISPETGGEVRDSVTQTLQLLDSGQLRVAQPDADTKTWQVHEWIKQAILLSFRLHAMQPIGQHWDKVLLKFDGWSAQQFQAAGFRAVPGAVVRHSAYIAPEVVLMPSFVNLGAYIDRGTMIDSWATVGSCAQIGKRVHISGGAGIGGVLEPLQSKPVIIEDEAFIGARCEVAEGVIVRQGAVLAMGVFLSASTKIVDRASGHIYRGEVPPYAVVVPGSLPDEKTGVATACAVIVKTVDARTRAKTAINDLLRE